MTLQQMLLGSAGYPSFTATFNPSDKGSNWALSGGNLVATYTPGLGNQMCRCTNGRSTGKWYFEFTVTNFASTSSTMGMASGSVSVNTYCGSTIDSWSYLSVGNKINNAVQTGGYPTYTTGDVIGVAVDIDAGKIWFSKNGSWIEGNPSAGTGASFTNVSGTVFPTISDADTPVRTANFGASAFANTPPTGFTKWNN